MEIRQLRYAVALADELHFGRAAAREHIVQSALSQHIRRLEREVGVPLFVRTTHSVALTRAGETFLPEARRVLARLEAAVDAVRRLPAAAQLRVAVGDASFDSMPRVLRAVQARAPDLWINQVEAGAIRQCRLLQDDRLDVGFGRATVAGPDIDSELVRLDPMAVMVGVEHSAARAGRLTMTELANETVLLLDAHTAADYNSFVVDMCMASGFRPKAYGGTAQSVRGAADLVAHQGCVLVVSTSCRTLPGVAVVPLVDPVTVYPWSLMWRSGSDAPVISLVRGVTRAMACTLGWMAPPDEQLGAVFADDDNMS